ncbi:MAG: hypothetical protein IPK60_18385 [Sandaracinaceae bacterium]|nr:hypothetical protein [Sandaracinaceae bacterium]
MSKRGIAPALLLQQVRNTAAWAIDGDSAESWRSYLLGAPKLEARWQKPESHVDYFSLMLAAHFTTVATFVPTDVDIHIRRNVWRDTPDADELARLVARIDEAESWDPRQVSNRWILDSQEGVLSGHDGEWFSVRAGALGRAIALRSEELTAKLEKQIRDQLDRHARIYTKLADSNALEALKAATVIAHNLGDLSRVVDTWEKGDDRTEALRHDFTRLGHEPREAYGTLFVEVGAVNKAVMADENHRYLPLRKPRVLRAKKEFAIPFGPFFDSWGERLATDELIGERELGEIVDTIIQGVTTLPKCAAYTRALAGIERKTKGGIARIVKEQLPVSTQRLAFAGHIREALRVSQSAFEAKVAKRFAEARAAALTQPIGEAETAIE